MNVDAIGSLVIGTVIASTKDQVNGFVDDLAKKIVDAVKSSETVLDEQIVRDLLVPAVDRLGAKVLEGLAA